MISIPAVVMPVFQGQQDYDDTMATLARSSIPSTVFVVDDGSTPPLEVREVNPAVRIRLIRFDRNRGIVAALNAGLEAAIAAKHRYIARIDAGDYAARDRLARQIDYLEKHPRCMLVGSDSIVRDEDGMYRFTIEPPRDPRALAHGLHERAWLLHPGVMYRAEVFEDVGFYSNEFPAAEDYEMFLRIARRHEIGVVPEPLLEYVTRTRSISARKARTQAISRLRIQARYFRWNRWICYYGMMRTIGTIILPDRIKQSMKLKFLYSRRLLNEDRANEDRANEDGAPSRLQSRAQSS
ncbi:MAG TPA: glycosyltransferase [Bryobacteraceae bacterium]|jgi:glycosyltransferase involved in cell wall biosynthesis|nr:glycosyltransferase [Bryobacteraceae bacterium]